MMLGWDSSHCRPSYSTISAVIWHPWTHSDLISPEYSCLLTWASTASCSFCMIEVGMTCCAQVHSSACDQMTYLSMTMIVDRRQAYCGSAEVDWAFSQWQRPHAACKCRQTLWRAGNRRRPEHRFNSRFQPWRGPVWIQTCRRPRTPSKTWSSFYRDLDIGLWT